jgi:putative membrane protein
VSEARSIPPAQGANAEARPVLPLAGAAAVSAFAVAGLLGAALASDKAGPLASHMALHLATMNVVAPLLAALWPRARSVEAGGTAWWGAGLAQMALLYAWHAPPLSGAAHGSAFLGGVLLAALFASALVFWRLVFADAAQRAWRAVAALLLTGKAACLVGALLIFAPRDLYALAGAGGLCGGGTSSLADQHLAGLLMVTACPLSYLIVGVGLVLRRVLPREETAAAPAERDLAPG